MPSAVVIVPVAYHAEANAISEALGHGPGAYTIPLAAAPDSGEPTHFACRADVSPAFIEMFTAAKEGVFPPELPEALQPAISAIEADFSDTLWGAEHLTAALDARGLERV